MGNLPALLIYMGVLCLPSLAYHLFCFPTFLVLFVLRFYGLVNQMGSCRARSCSLPNFTFTGQA